MPITLTCRLPRMGDIWRQIASTAFLVGVVGNLVASAVLGVPAFIHLHRKIDRHHREHMRFLNDKIRLDYNSIDGNVSDANSSSSAPSSASREVD